MTFQLKDYETVASRVLRFQKAYPNGAIQSTVVTHDQVAGLVYCEAKVWRDIADPMPSAIDGAFGIMKSFPANMQKFYVEDTLSSATGRALSLILEVTHKPTREDMSKVQVPREDDPWTTREVPQAQQIAQPIQEAMKGIEPTEIPTCPNCHDGRPLKWKDGLKKDGKPWGNFSCWTCKHVIWYDLASNGHWAPQKGWND